MSQPLQIITDSTVWKADSSSKLDFTIQLTPIHLTALDQALQRVKEAGLGVESITHNDFNLDSISDDVAQWREQVMTVTGLIILSGFPVDRYNKDELAVIHFGIGTHFGTAMSQSVMGDRLGHVVNVGGKDPKERAYRNSMELDMHTDSCDVVAMMCLQKAISGGISGYVSATAIYNEILQRRPDLMPILIEGFYYHRFGEEAPGQAPVTEEKIPIFSECEGFLSINYLRSYIEMAAEELKQPLSSTEVEALDLVDEIAQDDNFALKFITEPGEAVFFHNLAVLHNRTGFEDSDEPELKRHFLRLWLVAHNPRPVSDTWRIYEGRGISVQEGKSTYFDRELEYSRFNDDDGRM
jgi:hypothetical protein